jgi:hypothetical protein
MCTSCTRSGLCCKWPSAERTDGRRLRRRPGISTKCNSNDRGLENAEKPQVARYSPLNPFFGVEDNVAFLFGYCFDIFLPAQFHQTSCFTPVADLSYLYEMCLEFPLLQNAVTACAMIPMNRHSSDGLRDSAHQRYQSAITEISAGIADGSLTGREDHLLAAVIWLCIFEVSQHSWITNI